MTFSGRAGYPEKGKLRTEPDQKVAIHIIYYVKCENEYEYI